MGFKLRLSTPKKPEPEIAAKEICRKMRNRMEWLKFATHSPKNFREARIQIHLMRDRYYRDRGSSYYSQLVQMADRVAEKAAVIVNFNPEDWNNHRRGQQFRRLDELLVEFEVELFRSQRPARSAGNVVPCHSVTTQPLSGSKYAGF